MGASEDDLARPLPDKALSTLEVVSVFHFCERGMVVALLAAATKETFTAIGPVRTPEEATESWMESSRQRSFPVSGRCNWALPVKAVCIASSGFLLSIWYI